MENLNEEQLNQKEQLEKRMQNIHEELQKSVDKQIKEQIADKASEFIKNNKINELVFCPFVEEDSMKVAKEEFKKLESIINSTDCTNLCEQEKDKYYTIKERYQEFGEILNLNHLVIISNKDSLCTEYKMKYLPNHVNLQYIKTDKVEGTYVMNRGQVKFDMIQEPTIENPTKFEAKIEIVSCLKFPEETGCTGGADGTACKIEGCPICFEPKLND